MKLEEFLAEWQNDSPTVLAHTSGSTGKPKPMWVEKHRMQASARITCEFLGLHAGDTALLCLPLDYIAGKMMVVRSVTCGLRLVDIEPSGHPYWEGAVDFAAMVPLQVWNLLRDKDSRERLMQIRHLIIGGGAIDDSLATELKSFPNAVWSTYGMTETLSHIALRRLSGPDASDWYSPFPSVEVKVNADNCLVINAPLVYDGLLATNDIVELADGRFKVLGRKDNVICSGGLKIQIEEVERLLCQHLFQPFMITKRPDKIFGEQVVLLTESVDIADVEEVCRQVLPKYWKPRFVLHVSQLPLTATGKPARKEAEHIAEDLLNG